MNGINCSRCGIGQIICNRGGCFCSNTLCGKATTNGKGETMSEESQEFDTQIAKENRKRRDLKDEHTTSQADSN